MIRDNFYICFGETLPSEELVDRVQTKMGRRWNAAFSDSFRYGREKSQTIIRPEHEVL